MNDVRYALRLKHYSLATERSYCYYILDYIRVHGKRHPRFLGAYEVRDYLSHLATNKHIAASAQNVALSALLFLYGTVLQQPLGNITDVVRAKRPKRIPTVLTLAVTLCVTVLPHTFWKMAMIFGRCKSFWGIRMSKPP
jgi:hypothetical protein